MPVKLPLELLQWLYKVLLNEYVDPKKTYQDVCLILMNFPSFKPRTRTFHTESGKSELLLNLYGTIEVPEQFQLQLPVDIWIPLNYPFAPPMVYLLNDRRYIIKPTNNVQPDGLIYHPFLYNWNNMQDDEPNKRYRAIQLMSLLKEIFSNDVPCIFKPNVAVNQSPVSTKPFRPISATPVGTPPNLPPKPRPTSPLPSAPTGSSTPMSPGTPGSVSSNITASRSTTRQLKSPVYREFEQLSLMDQDSAPASPGNGSAPTLPPNPTRQQALDMLNINLQYILQNEVTDIVNSDLLCTLEETSKETAKLQDILATFKQEQLSTEHKIATNDKILDEKIPQVKAINEGLIKEPELNLDQIITAPTLQHQQLYELVTKDKALSDTINTVVKLYELERIQLTQMMKYTRNLARDQFFCRALIKKIVKKLNLYTEAKNP